MIPTKGGKGEAQEGRSGGDHAVIRVLWEGEAQEERTGRNVGARPACSRRLGLALVCGSGGPGGGRWGVVGVLGGGCDLRRGGRCWFCCGSGAHWYVRESFGCPRELPFRWCLPPLTPPSSQISTSSPTFTHTTQTFP